MKRLSVGDALAVAALLLFICGWVALFAVYVLWRVDNGSLPRNPDDWSTGEGVWSLLVAGWPSVWAGHLVSAIVTKDDKP